jgi:hypothetical protein
MASKKDRMSKHGTLNENDTEGAVGINVNMVLEHTQTATTAELFGAAGKLPPTAAQRVEPRYTVFHTFRDDKADTPWIGLNKVTNADKGDVPAIALSPGEYKIELKLNKMANRNIAHDLGGAVVGSVQSLVEADEDKASATRARGMPNSYVDVHFAVQAKRYAITDVRGVLDLGVFSTFSRVFVVQPHESEASFKLDLYSHSVLKRLKVEGALFRRDFAPEEEDSATVRRNAAKGREILKKALSAGEGKGAAAPAPAPPPPPALRGRLDPDVDIKVVVQAFYEAKARDRLGNLPVVFKHFAGRDDDLIATLEAKYGVKFDARGRFA